MSVRLCAGINCLELLVNKGIRTRRRPTEGRVERTSAFGWGLAKENWAARLASRSPSMSAPIAVEAIEGTAAARVSGARSAAQGAGPSSGSPSTNDMRSTCAPWASRTVEKPQRRPVGAKVLLGRRATTNRDRRARRPSPWADRHGISIISVDPRTGCWRGLKSPTWQ